MEMQPKAVASLGEIIRSAWEVVRANLVVFLLVTLIVSIPVNALLGLLPFSGEGGYNEFRNYFQFQNVLQFWIGTIGVLGMIHLTVASQDGVRLSVGETFARVFKGYMPAIWTLFLFDLAVGVGLVLLLIPGLIVGVYWFFYLQVLVVHGTAGKDAMVHSHRLVKGRWWKIFGRLAAVYLLLAIGAVLVLVPTIFFPDTYILGIISVIPLDLLISFAVVCITRLFLLSDPGQEVDSGEADYIVT